MHSVNKMALSATLHCLLGCSIGEVAGMIIGVWFGLGVVATVAISIALAFISGYSLSLLPLVRNKIPLASAMKLVLAADTLSILTMEIVDNAVIVVLPGAMSAGLTDLYFWATLALSLFIAFWVAFPVNRYLLSKGKGHALMHEYHSHSDHSR
ncbi:MAG TPA: DUF4396 domain-containing protein [Candidatus Saccharibacteria bacterium]|nr:DUF4396 domain-containing protein [Candidatus Saccharibacteria bacterium]